MISKLELKDYLSELNIKIQENYIKKKHIKKIIKYIHKAQAEKEEKEEKADKWFSHSSLKFLRKIWKKFNEISPKEPNDLRKLEFYKKDIINAIDSLYATVQNMYENYKNDNEIKDKLSIVFEGIKNQNTLNRTKNKINEAKTWNDYYTILYPFSRTYELKNFINGLLYKQKSLNKQTKEWLIKWINYGKNDIPNSAIIRELSNYRSQKPIKIYRGLRGDWKKINIGDKQIINSDKLSSWSTNINIAKKFAVHEASHGSQHDAMLLWIKEKQNKNKKSERGGWILEAFVRPEDQLVVFDFLPYFGDTKYGQENEVLILPNTIIKAKVIKIFDK